MLFNEVFFLIRSISVYS